VGPDFQYKSPRQTGAIKKAEKEAEIKEDPK
jgi:hypothetical protein